MIDVGERLSGLLFIADWDAHKGLCYRTSNWNLLWLRTGENVKLELTAIFEKTEIKTEYAEKIGLSLKNPLSKSGKKTLQK